jgi:hypothetical protein
MENTLLEALKGVNGNIVAESHSTDLTFEFGGSIVVKRGTFEQKIYFYAHINESRHKGVIQINDWDVNDVTDVKLGDLPIDNLDAFKQKLKEWGLSSLANNLDITTENQKIAISQCLLQDKQLKLLFGKNFKVWELLSVEEQKLLELKFVIEKFNPSGNHLQTEVARYYKINEINTTLDDFKTKLAELAK